MKKQVIKSNAAFVAIGDPNALATRTRTNLLTNSVGVDTNIGWVLGPNMVRVGKATDPDGSNTATTYRVATAGNAYVVQSLALSANTTYTFSVYARLNSGSIPTDGQLLIVDYDTNNNAANYERTTGLWTGLSSKWERFSITFTNIAAITGNFYVVGDWSNGAYIDVWGAQLEKSSIKTDFIATNGSQVTVTEKIDRAKLFSLVQNCNFSLSNNRQNLKQIGNQKHAVSDLVRAPNVDLSFDYYLSPYLNNELLMGFNGEYPFELPALPNIKNKNNNFYILIDTEDSDDGFDEVKKLPTSGIYNHYSIMSFGNAYLKSYSVDFKVGQIPTVSVSYSCSNMKYENINLNNSINIPSLTYSGQDSGILDLQDLYYSLPSGYISGDLNNKTSYDVPVVNVNNSNFILSNLQVGGVPLFTGSYPLLQSFGLSLDFNRVDLYGLGNNYVYNRKAQFPINAQIKIDALVSGINSGVISGLIYNESEYNLGVQFTDSKNSATGFYNFKNANLENYNYSMPVNNMMTFSASFAVQITEVDGFFMGRLISNQISSWANEYRLWSNIGINWNSV
jgi:hypothetical protein